MDHRNTIDRLFVYGTLVDPAERARLLGRPIEAIPARLIGYSRGMKRYYFVRKDLAGSTSGAILEGLSERDLAILDQYEDLPNLYIREQVTVFAADGREMVCWIYLPTGWASEGS